MLRSIRLASCAGLPKGFLGGESGQIARFHPLKTLSSRPAGRRGSCSQLKSFIRISRIQWDWSALSESNDNLR